MAEFQHLRRGSASLHPRLEVARAVSRASKEGKPLQAAHAVFLLTLALSPLPACPQANTPATPASAAPSTAPAPAAAAPATASSLLQPTLTLVQTTLNSLKLDKWKKGSVRDEAQKNVNAMLNDLQSNVPPLVAAADAEPATLSKSIPLIKHVDALYDVFLRVEEASRVSAPGDQVDSLAQTLKSFGGARIDFYDSLQQNAAAEEKQVGDLQTSLKAQQAAAKEAKPVPAPAPCTAPKPVVKKKRPAPAKPKPAAPGQATPAQTPPPAPPKTP